MERSTKSSQESRKEDVCDESHDWYVHVWGVEVLSRWQEVVGVARLILATSRRRSLLPRPRLVPPGKEDEYELAEHIGGCDIKVVLQS